ncbi:hypothetical protein [Thermococcus henrietii]|uniref:hypothetical protein n=1 Tax=Thermococcus henrietii TaxID=2016361 RepID=UPI000C07B988|nr:hypothetical protein [Thermococcus henrietii]
MRAELFRLERVRVRIHYRALVGGTGYLGEFIHEARNTTEQEAIKRALKEFAEERAEQLCDGATLEIKVEEGRS